MPEWGTTKDENAVGHFRPDPESRHKRPANGSRSEVRYRLRQYDDVFSDKLTTPVKRRKVKPPRCYRIIPGLT